MPMPKVRYLALAACLMAGGCVQHTYAPGPGMSVAAFEPDSAQCRLFARQSGTNHSFQTSGSPKSAAAGAAVALIGIALFSAVEQNHNYHDCMQSHGWQIADGSRPGLPPANGGMVVPDQEKTVVTAVSGMTDGTRDPATGRRRFMARAANVDGRTAVDLRMLAPVGVLLMDVQPGGAAWAAGLRADDVVLRIDDESITSADALARRVSRLPAGSRVQFTIWRESAENTVRVAF